MARDVFAVHYRCENCGKEWTDEYAERVRVGDARGDDPRVVVNDLDCEDFGCSDCCGPVGCPNCLLFAHVTVDGREPV